jgi:hypothetical protein
VDAAAVDLAALDDEEVLKSLQGLPLRRSSSTATRWPGGFRRGTPVIDLLYR